MFWLYHNGGWVVQWRNTNAYAYSYSITHSYAKGNPKATANTVSSANALRMKDP